MVACLERTDGNADFHEIVDFLTTSPIHYALTVSPTIYASYIEQFWNTAHSQTVNDVKQIHATVDGKTVVISESSVRSDLHFNDEDGITCLTNETIFENLALMGYESDSDKLTFQKALFSPQWKYLIHTILHCLSSKSTSWNEFSTNIASAVICLANGQKFNFSKLIFDGMLRNLDTNTKKFLMYPRFLQLFLNNQISLVEPFNDIYKTHVHTKKVFTNMKRKGKDFSGRITPLFASMLAPPVVEGEGSGQPTEPQPTPSTTQPIIEEQIPVTESSSPQNTQSPRQALHEHTQLPQTSVPIPNVADEAVFKEWDDRVVRATTTAASLDAAQASGNITKTQSMAMSNDPLSQEIGSGDRPRCQEAMGGVIAQTRSERASKHSYDSPFPRFNTPGSCTPRSDEGRPDLHEWMDICTKLSDRVLDLEKEKDAQAMEILKLKNKIKNLERKAKSSIPPPKRRLYKQVDSFDDSLGSGGTKVFDDTTAVEKDVNITELISTADDAGTTTSVIPDIDIADLQMSTRPRTTSVVIQDVEEELRRATLVPTVKIQDKEVKDAALIVEFDNVQARMEANALLAVRLKEEEREQFSINEQARFLVETIVERKRFFAVQRAEQIRNKPPTKTQLRNKMITYLKNIGSKDSGKKDDSSSKQAGSRKKRAWSKLKSKSQKKLKVMKEQESAVDDADK
ncbi:hypothetical protein Tco_0420957 [Tanacetum coccineum]